MVKHPQKGIHTLLVGPVSLEASNEVRQAHPNQKALRGISQDELEGRAELLVKHFFNRFDILAISNPATGKPLPVYVDNIDAAVSAHLGCGNVPEAEFKDKWGRVYRGRFRLGTYLPLPHGYTKFGVVDIDGGSAHKFPLRDPKGAANQISSKLSAFGISNHIERSGSGEGFHVWVFWRCPVSANAVREVLRSACSGEFPLVNGGLADPKLGRGLEIFPKQSKLGSIDAVGNLVFLPWYHGCAVGCSEFVATDDYRVITLPSFSINSESSLIPWINHLKPAIGCHKPSGRSELRTTTASTDPGRFDYLRKIARACVVTRDLLNQCRRPPEQGMTHEARRTLAQIAKSAGLSDNQIAKLFRRQPDFSLDVCLTQIKSIKYIPACKNIGPLLGLCSGRCDAIRAIKRGSPFAFLENQYHGRRG